MMLVATLCACAFAQSAVVGVPQSAYPDAPALSGADAITIPQMLSYQGKLTDTTGIPVPDGDYSVVFRLYTAPSGGSPVWNETQNVTTKDGLFSILLGSVTPIGSMPDGGAAYLAMVVEGGAELSPRLRIASAGYAYLSGRAANADLLQGKDTTAFDSRYVNEAQASSVTGAMLVDGTVQTADIADTAVTMAKIARAGATTGQVVKWTGSAWAPGPDNTGGGSGVTNVYQDTGIVCVPNPITTSGNVKLDLSYGDGRYVNEAQANSITSAMITDGNVTSADIRDTTVNTAELKDGAVTSAKVLDGTITSADIRDTTVNTAELKDAAVTAPKLNQMGATTNQVLKWTGSAWAPGNDSGDNAWVRGTPDSVLYTIRRLGLSRGGVNNILHGNNRNNHINFGSHCTTGTSGRDNNNCAIGGGQYNAAGGAGATVAGGGANRAMGLYATVSGGANGAALDTGGTVGGGRYNYAAQRYATVAGGSSDTANGSYAAALSGYSNLAGDAVSDTGACVAGGYDNTASAPHSFVGGGYGNLASSASSFVGGGHMNRAHAAQAAVAGGTNNLASGIIATIGGGTGNTAAGVWSSVGSGSGNTAGDAATDTAAVVAGGRANQATDRNAAVGGGRSNRATGYSSVVSGGYGNLASGDRATVGGGYADTASAQYATVGGGTTNRATATAATIAGGDVNLASDIGAAVGGGRTNTASADYATVAGGIENTASGYGSVVGGGDGNLASGNYSTVAGGVDNQARAFGTFAGGYNARARHRGSFVWSDSIQSASESLTSGLANSFLVRARGRTTFYSSASAKGVRLEGEDNSWTSIGFDQDMFNDARSVDRRAVLDKVAALPMRDYQREGKDGGVRHIGVTAQEFHGALGYGPKDGINSGDMDGVLLAAVQALYELTRNQQAEIEALKAELKRR